MDRTGVHAGYGWCDRNSGVRSDTGEQDVMVIETSRFGGIEVDDQRFLNFPKGLLGFPDDREYALIQTGENSAFYWMQAVHRPELAFVVCDPRMFVPDYRVVVKAEDLGHIGLTQTHGSQVFVIVNKYEDQLTANLQGPLILNIATRVGKQLVLADKRYSTRHPLMDLPVRQASVSRSA
ncbi:MAG TPA: flagellar assembly protein FliW [Phycisphaerae bacterium]|nr:flagellar assembly protein FliW [Phycisphaerae bacterium]